MKKSILGSMIPALSVSAVLVIAGAAQATITIFTSQASFGAATSPASVDTFNDLPLSSAPSPLFRTVGPFSYTASVSTTSFFMAGTAGDVWLSTNTATDTITLSAFGGGVQAAGGFFFASDINGAFAAGDVMLTATDADGTVNHTIISATATSFVGFLSNQTLTSLTIKTVQPAGGFLWPTANDLRLAQQIPTPGAAAMLGLVGLAAGRRRRA